MPKTYQALVQLGLVLANDLDICAFLVGGSTAYRAFGPAQVIPARDFDCAIVLSTVSSIFKLITTQQSLARLLELIGITTLESGTLATVCADPDVQTRANTVRLAGFARDGQKISVKLLAEESFGPLSNGANNVLSYKDRRVYHVVSHHGMDSFKMQQSSKAPEDFVILHDQWTYSKQSHDCCQRSSTNPKGYGITADLLLTGLWMYGGESVGRSIQKRLLSTFAAGTKGTPSIEHFAKHKHFTIWYAQYLTDLLFSAHIHDVLSSECSCPPRTQFLFNKLPTKTSKLGKIHRLLKLKHHSDDLEALYDSSMATIPSQNALSRFSSNSKHGIIVLQNIDKTQESIFWKTNDFTNEELGGARLAAKYFPFTQEPFVTKHGHMLFPEFKGRTQSEWRYELYTASIDTRLAICTVLDTELRKAEDTLAAYVSSLNVSLPPPEVKQPIHRFFYDRLSIPGTRLQEFYPNGVMLGTMHITLHELMQARLTINGETYPPLGTLIERCLHTLDPSSHQLLRSPRVFGLGDAHGGNIMISDSINTQGYRDLLYIDYEVSGHHSLLLDLAKPLMNDVFFQTLHGDTLTMPGTFSASVEDGQLGIDLSGCGDDLSKAILAIKREYLIDPICSILDKTGQNPDTFVSILGHALLSCALFTRNYSGHWEALWRNIAIGVTLSQAGSFEDLWSSFDALLGG